MNVTEKSVPILLPSGPARVRNCASWGQRRRAIIATNHHGPLSEQLPKANADPSSPEVYRTLHGRPGPTVAQDRGNKDEIDLRAQPPRPPGLLTWAEGESSCFQTNGPCLNPLPNYDAVARAPKTMPHKIGHKGFANEPIDT